MKWNQFTANCAFIPYTFLLYVIPLYWSIVSLRISESPRAQRPHNYWQHNLSCPASHCHKISHGRPVKRQRQRKSRNRKIQSSTNNPSLLHPKTPYLICLQPIPPCCIACDLTIPFTHFCTLLPSPPPFSINFITDRFIVQSNGCLFYIQLVFSTLISQAILSCNNLWLIILIIVHLSHSPDKHWG